MNKPLLFGFIAIVVVLLGLPLLARQQQGNAATQDANPASTASTYSSSAVPVSPASLENTSWSVNTDQGAVTVSLLPGGRVVATPPPALAGIIKTMSGRDTLEGTWSMNGNRLTASVNAMGKTQTIQAEVVNGQVMYNGQPATRVQ